MQIEKEIAWGCAQRINTTSENLQIEKHKSVRWAERTPSWFVLFDLQIFRGGVYPLNATSRTISFSISNSFWYYEYNYRGEEKKALSAENIKLLRWALHPSNLFHLLQQVPWLHMPCLFALRPGPPPPPLEAILVIFGRRALIFFCLKALGKYEKWHHFRAHAQWWST